MSRKHDEVIEALKAARPTDSDGPVDWHESEKAKQILAHILADGRADEEPRRPRRPI